jgi:hypothetical protein
MVDSLLGVCPDLLTEELEEWTQPNPRRDLVEGLPTVSFRVVVPAPLP